MSYAQSDVKIRNLRPLGRRGCQLSGNNIGDDGAIALTKSSEIIGLELENCNIGDLGAIALSKMVINNLNIRKNPISNLGKEALKNSKTIVALSLDEDDFLQHSYQKSSHKHINIFYDYLKNHKRNLIK